MKLYYAPNIRQNLSNITENKKELVET